MELLIGSLTTYMGVTSIIDSAKVGSMLDDYTLDLDTSIDELSSLKDRSDEFDSMFKDVYSNEFKNTSSMIDYYLNQYPRKAKTETSNQTQTFNTTQGQTAKQTSSNIQTQKEEFFKKNHYQFTSSGNPVTDTDGNPVAFSNPNNGPEPEEAKTMRLAWEEKQVLQIDQKYNETKKQVVSKAVDDLRSAITYNLSNLGDPEVQENMKQIVARGEHELRNLEHNKQLDIIKTGLPTYELKKQLEEAAGKLREEEARFFAEMEKSRAGKQMKEYQQMVNEFLWNQKRRMAENHSGSSIATSPSLLAYLVPSSNNQELADGVQDMLKSINSQYSFRS